jgi:hypothetical protein
MAFLKSLVSSKKGAAMVAGVIMAAFGKKLGLDEAAVTSIVATVVAYLVGQGIADHGKEAAKVQA